jgi:hypothetical protein
MGVRMMTEDWDIVLRPSDRATTVVSEYRRQRDAVVTVNELIAILDHQELAGALRRMSTLTVVK